MFWPAWRRGTDNTNDVLKGHSLSASVTGLPPLLRGLFVFMVFNTLLTETPQMDLSACLPRHSGVFYDSLNLQFWLFREPRTWLPPPCPRSLSVMGRKALGLRTQTAHFGMLVALGEG